MLTGYTSDFSVEPGETIDFMVATTAPRYTARLVRLIHGDRNPEGPGFKQEELPGDFAGEYPGGMQRTRPGSYGHADGLKLPSGPFALSAWIFPTKLNAAEDQCVCAITADAGDLRLVLKDSQFVVVRGRTELVKVEQTLQSHAWHFVYAAVDSDGTVEAEVRKVDWPTVESHSTSRVELPDYAGVCDIYFGAAPSERRRECEAYYDGKVSEPRLYGRALTSEERIELAGSEDGIEIAKEALLGAWSLSSDPSLESFVDRSGHGHAGVFHNRPASAMTDHTWQGDQDWTRSPEGFRAVHFHSDDLIDAEWEPNFSWRVPDDLSSGIYAAWLRTDDREDHIPFVVRPKNGEAQSEIGVLISSFTYLAYANERLTQTNEGIAESGIFAKIEMDPREEEWDSHLEFGLSLYDVHSDGSGCCYAGMKRPILNLRPDYRAWMYGAPRGLGADLYLTDWLEHKGFRHDSFTDGDLHLAGQALLARYKVIITSSHPEYWSAQMLDALQSYLDAGGRLMYLGGNGFYWVTSVDPTSPDVIEVRRGYGGMRAWESEPGEYHHSTTGERGGLWRYRGRSPNTLVGIGFASEGFSEKAPGYRRSEDSAGPLMDLVFAGVDEDPIGDYGLVMGGSAGDEIDRADRRYGTPHHTAVLASATDYDDHYHLVVEDIRVTASGLDGSNPGVRSDITFTETPNGGAVFSAGSIIWRASLSHDGYDNGVSRITENVLRTFLHADRFP